MPHLKLTKRSIEDLPLATGKGLIYWDTDTPGFGLVVGRAQKSFIAQRQRLGRTTRKALGVFGEITVDQARHAALQTVIAIRNGDMLRETQERKKRESLTLMRVFDMFVQSRKDIRPRTLHDYQSTMRLYLNDWSGI